MKRYDSYKDSGVQWVGEIPNHWEIIKGKYCTKVICGLPFDSNKFTKEDGYIGLIRIRDISNNVTDMNYTGKYPKEALVHTGEILIGMDGDFNVEKWKGNDALLNQRVCKIVDTKTVLSNYMYYLLPRPLKCINDVTYSTTVKHLSTFDIANLTLPLPPACEQQAIASYLDKRCGEIDKAIAKQQKRIELLQELRQNIITNAVTRGINPDAPLKDSGVEWIGQVPEHWEIIKGKYCTKVICGLPFDSNKFTKEDGYIGLIRIRDISNNVTDMNYTGKYPKEALVHTGEILIGMDGDFNVEKWKGNDALLNQRVCKIVDTKTVLSNYMYYLLPRPLKCINDVTYSTTVKHLSTFDIANLTLPLPPACEQQAIASYLDKRCGEIDKAIAKQQKRIELLQELKQSIITEVVTGKRKVC